MGNEVGLDSVDPSSKFWVDQLSLSVVKMGSGFKDLLPTLQRSGWFDEHVKLSTLPIIAFLDYLRRLDRQKP